MPVVYRCHTRYAIIFLAPLYLCLIPPLPPTYQATSSETILPRPPPSALISRNINVSNFGYDPTAIAPFTSQDLVVFIDELSVHLHQSPQNASISECNRQACPQVVSPKHENRCERSREASRIVERNHSSIQKTPIDVRRSPVRAPVVCAAACSSVHRVVKRDERHGRRGGQRGLCGGGNRGASEQKNSRFFVQVNISARGPCLTGNALLDPFCTTKGS